MTANCYLWLTSSWRIQFPLNKFYDPEAPDALWDIYVSMRFEGPTYGMQDVGVEDRVFVDRIILVKATDTD